MNWASTRNREKREPDKSGNYNRWVGSNRAAAYVHLQLLFEAAARARPERFGLRLQAEAARRPLWGMGGAGAGLPRVTAAWRGCGERDSLP